MKIVQKDWGEELWIVNNDLYCGKILILNRAHRCSMHYHKIKDETFYISEGIVFIEYDGAYSTMYVGETLHIPVGMYHRFTGIKDSKIIEFSTHHEDSDSYRIEKGGKVDLEKYFAELQIEHEKHNIPKQ